MPTAPLSKDALNSLATRIFTRLGYSDRRSRDARREAWWWFQARAQALSRRTGLASASAVVFTRAGVAELLPVEVPEARDGEVTVEIATSAVSPGTEQAFYLQLPNTTSSYPFPPGYSAAGTVLSAPGTRFERGDRVAVRGVGHASVATAPASAVHLVPEGVAIGDAAFVQLGVICGYGVGRAAIEPGEAVVVVGAGLIGALAARLALVAGAGSVVVIARSRAKESAALAGGASRFLTSDDADQIASLGAPVVIEATGDAGALDTAVLAAGDAARVVVLGSARSVIPNIPLAVIRAKRMRLIGAHVAALGTESRLAGRDLAAAEALAFLENLAVGRVRVDDLVDEIIDPRECDAFYRRLTTMRSLVCAQYDWTLLPRQERVSRARLLRAPPLSASGVDMSTPLPPRKRRAAVPASGPPESGLRLRIGLLGCGDIAILNAAAIASAPNTQLVACFDPVEAVARELATAYGASYCAASDELLARSDVDAVLLCVPHHVHLEMGEEAADAGKHVIVEKPLANDLTAARMLVDAAARANVWLSVCFPHRYHPDVVEARRLLTEGAVGAIEGMLVTLSTDKTPSYWSGGFSGRVQTSWRRSKEMAGGGVLIMNLSHYIDLFRHLTNLEAATVAALVHAQNPASEVEDTIALTVRYSNGAVGSILGSGATRGTSSESQLRLWGADGHLTLEPRPLVFTQRTIRGLRTGRWQSFGSSHHLDVRAEYFRRLASAVGAGEPPEVTGSDGLAVQAFIEAAYRSAADETIVSPHALLGERA